MVRSTRLAVLSALMAPISLEPLVRLMLSELEESATRSPLRVWPDGRQYDGAAVGAARAPVAGRRIDQHARRGGDVHSLEDDGAGAVGDVEDRAVLAGHSQRPAGHGERARRALGVARHALVEHHAPLVGHRRGERDVGEDDAVRPLDDGRFGAGRLVGAAVHGDGAGGVQGRRILSRSEDAAAGRRDGATTPVGGQGRGVGARRGDLDVVEGDRTALGRHDTVAAPAGRLDGHIGERHRRAFAGGEGAVRARPGGGDGAVGHGDAAAGSRDDGRIESVEAARVVARGVTEGLDLSVGDGERSPVGDEDGRLVVLGRGVRLPVLALGVAALRVDRAWSGRRRWSRPRARLWKPLRKPRPDVLPVPPRPSSIRLVPRWTCRRTSRSPPMRRPKRRIAATAGTGSAPNAACACLQRVA